MSTYMGYTHDQMIDIITEHERMVPLKETKAWRKMELEANHEVLRKKLTETRENLKRINAALKKLEGENP